MKILSFHDHSLGGDASIISMANDADPREVSLEGISRVDLQVDGAQVVEFIDILITL